MSDILQLSGLFPPMLTNALTLAVLVYVWQIDRRLVEFKVRLQNLTQQLEEDKNVRDDENHFRAASRRQ